MTLINNTKDNTNKNKAYNKNKQNILGLYAKFKDVNGFE